VHISEDEVSTAPSFAEDEVSTAPSFTEDEVSTISQEERNVPHTSDRLGRKKNLELFNFQQGQDTPDVI